ncbi:serine/threonine-protein kinase AFC3 isoform X1 [Selaginella moellendorffii]|uniref:serine/threonine-protein kinase AFC3 isoform X1 n=2 Tax=Selaginella moellendorffii TaxID=88036 RepID=UPI000D1C7175|nr:serine/threonine-protein kinase AFC3 isoform X1 [Selaginella moellendorffii]|eukprot:XP_024526874.1 serine/threonine-protein kinase AFC3 isoform X1 [Selaginella moellendorffii]
MERRGKRPRSAYRDEEAQPSSYVSRHHKEQRANYNGFHSDTLAASPPWREDDKDGHYVFELGENITPRYKVISKMGEGTFGRVLECWDRKYQEFVAVKVIRNVPKYREAALIEIDVLRALRKHDKNGKRGCLQMKEWFDYRNHVCIVSEKLGPSLYDFLKKNSYRPFSIEHVRDIGWQLLNSVACMPRLMFSFIAPVLLMHCCLLPVLIDLHELSLIHTDLKPENILLVSSAYVKTLDYKSARPDKHLTRTPTSAEIRLIDFGSATFENQHHSSIVSTRQYRAPEIILGLGWSYACDLWSVGCILVELFSGDPLFQTHENLEHLAMMERILGPISRRIIDNVDRKAQKYFKNGRELNWPDAASSLESIRTVKRLPRLKELVQLHVEHSASSLTDLLEGLLRYGASDRLTAKEALRHPFFKERR